LKQGYNAIQWEIQNQRKEFNKLFNEFDKFEIIEKNLSDTINSKFDIVKSDLQTIDENNQLILLSKNEIKNVTQLQLSMLNSIKENMNNIPNVINYVVQEKFDTFSNTRRKENDDYTVKLEGNLNQEFNIIQGEMQYQRKEFKESIARFDDYENMGKKHHEIMVMEFHEAKELEHYNCKQII
jgi:hypothetical protein